MKTAREYVVSFLHHTGDNNGLLSESDETDIRFKYADGFGNLTLVANTYDMETLEEMLWDWSHVRDSSDEAFDRMARVINEIMVKNREWNNDLLYDECQPTYKELRAEFDHYTLYEPNETATIARLSEQLQNY